MRRAERRVVRPSDAECLTLERSNTSSNAIPGPISFVLDSLSAGASLVNAAGATACAAPAGRPYVNVNVGSDSLLSVRERANVALEFTLEFTSSGPITYTPRVLAGSGGR